ncbi:helix-turn-helix domain-containing protein [Agrilactobacillus yilanensis]|uniref:Helix-turn-helix domain-containing protein n=1 Tax=Agrilactobacillus yilanensis TaxID=2485997 RepID=A0ABW4J3M6_9LACO|nr:helix-turn-helix transcriptional regulator [Agrilactobacillus yilanensis]
MTIFDKTKEAAEKRGMSLQDVARKAGLGINSIYAWKKRDPSITRIKAVAKVLKVSSDELLGIENADNPKIIDIEDDHVLMTFEGKPIPPDDLEIIKRLLRGAKK